MPDKTKKEVAYVAKSVGTNNTQRHNNAKEMLGKDAKYGNKGGIGEKEMTVNTAYNSMLPEFEVKAITKMYGSPSKQTVDPTTGNVIPDMSGTGPTNSMNDQTAVTVQAQADSLAIKENRAAKPNNPASSAVQTPMTMQGNFKNSSINNASRMFGNVGNPVPSPQQFNAGLREASANGKLNPGFKKAVDAAPIKAKGNPGKGTSLDTFEVNFKKETGNRSGKGNTDGQTTNSRINKDGTKTSVDTYKGEKAEGTIQKSF